MKRMLMIVLLAVIAILAAVQPQLSCRRIPVPADKRPQEGLPTVTMQLGGKKFTLEVANTEPSRQTGLMHRDSMAGDHGMIFTFAEPEHLGFWMKNTRIPLDIIYIGEDQRIVSIHQMKPHDTRSVPAAGLAKWAIELNDGTAARLGLKAGDKLDIPQPAMQAAD